MATGFDILNAATARVGAASVAAILAAAAIGAPSQAEAQETLAGSSIRNIAEVAFDQSGDRLTVPSNTVEVQVAERLDVQVTTLATEPLAVRGGERSQAFGFSVTNTGNGVEAFALTGVTPAGGEDVRVVGLAIDSDGDGSYDPAVDLAYVAGSNDPVLDAGARVTIFVLADVNAAQDADQAQVQLVAQALTGAGAQGDVFAGRGDQGGDAVVGHTGARAHDNAGLVVSTGSASLEKRQSVRDPMGGTAAVVGSTITYELIVRVTGSRVLDEVTVTDPIPAGAAYVPGSLSLDGRALTDSGDIDAGSGGTGGIAVTLGRVSAAGAHRIAFQVLIT